MPAAVTEPVRRALGKRPCQSWHLLLDKLSFPRGGDPDAKTKVLVQVRDTYRSASDSLAKSARARHRFLDALGRQHGNRLRSVKLMADSRLLLHLGRSSVLENVGLCADRTTGLPLIPGTALKGVLSTWSCWESAGDALFVEKPQIDTRRRDLSRRIFGDNSDSGSTRSGDIVFVGGVPETPPEMGLDIVNPHHEASGVAKTNLTPNVFLCVEPGTTWRFVFFARPCAAEAAALLDTTTRWLGEGLTQIGIGAKTAAGYGRFRELSVAELQANEAAEAKAGEQARVVAILASDFSDASFPAVLQRLQNPGRHQEFQQQDLPKLQRSENAAFRDRLRSALATSDFKDVRKRLKDKPWFPKDWLPSP